MDQPRAWKDKTKEFSAKRLLAIVICFGLCLLGYLFLPITTIHYQAIDVSQPGTNASAAAAYVSYAKQNQDPEDSIPCQFPKFTTAAGFWSGFRFQIWQALGFLFLFLIPIALASGISPYSDGRKARFQVILAIYVVSFLLLIGLLLLFIKSPPDCNPNVQYKLISSAPYWPSYVFVLAAYFMLRYIVKRWIGGLTRMPSKVSASGS